MTIAAQNGNHLELPINPKHPRETFLSPFSRKVEAEIFWQKISSRWRGFESSKYWLNTNDLEAIQNLSTMQMASNLQLIKFYPNREKAKKRLKKLSNAGVFIRHQLVTPRQKIPIYTLGPVGANIIDYSFTANWWMNKSVYGVMRQLIANQLFLRMKDVKIEANIHPAHAPFNGIIKCHKTEFLISVTNGTDISQEMKWENSQRLFIICESFDELIETANQIKTPARFTTDYELFTINLVNAFYRYEANELVPDEIPMF